MAKMTLDGLVAQLSAIYGGDLVCAALYGSAARGERLERHSDINVFVVVERITMEHLRKEAPLAQSWREAGNPPPLTLTRAEWVGSADIFPIEYADILAFHKVLAGALPIEGVSVSPDHLRLQLEHEAMSKLLRLRHAVMQAGRDAKGQLAVMEDASSTMLVLLRALLRLLGEEPPADSEAVCARVRERCGIDTSPWARVVRHLRGREALAPRDAEVLVEGYLGSAQALVTYLDRYIHQA